jgi:hypothetical protein
MNRDMLILCLMVFGGIMIGLATLGNSERIVALELHIATLETTLSHSACISSGPDYRIVPCVTPQGGSR